MRWKSGRRSRNIEDRRGSSKQRVRWFRQGLETGDISQCNTFKADNL